MTERSVLANPGPTMALRPRLPKWNTPLGDTGTAKTELGPQEPAMRGSHTVFSNHLVGSPTIVGSPIRSGRNVLVVPVNVPMLLTTLRGLPLCACTIRPISQPSLKALPVNGRS